LLSRVPGIEIYTPDELITSNLDKSADKLKEEINRAHVILMLVSFSFVASPIFKFIMDELSTIEEGPLPPPATTWMLIDYVSWHETPLREYQPAISPDEPLGSMSRVELQHAMELLAAGMSDFLSTVHDWPGASASPPLPPPESSQFVSPPSSVAPPTEAMGSPPFSPPPAQQTPLTSPPATASPPYRPKWPSSVPSGESPPSARAGTKKGPSLSESPPRSDATSASRVAGFRPDSVKGKDRLDVRPEALTLAMVLAHKDVEPPISVGLFGDWGSGKSFFMREMRLLIDALSRRSRGGKGRFCENIVQLDFNAWHYMDSNLWASLAREIFEGLATAVAEKEKQPGLDLERERLRAATQSTKDLIAVTEVQVVEVQRRMDETQRQLNTVQREQDSVKNVSVAATMAVLQTPEVEKELREVAGRLGIDQASKNLGELKEQVVDLTAAGRRGRAVIAGMKERGFGLLLGLVLSVAAAFVLYEVLQRYGQEIASLVARISALAGILAAALATVGRAGKAILRRAESFKKSFDANLKSQKEAREREIRAKQQSLDEERRKLEAQWNEQQKELERLKTLSRQLGELDSSRQLVDFIRARDASSDYRGKLGTVARASQDFKRLSDLMARATLARERIAAGFKSAQDEEDARLPRIDRIVLYIDDLDRCPTNKVVDVLQAVHLLLAYPLFVVVVGVDPRWLLHSLEEHSGAFRISESPDGDKQSEDWRSTSLNYLEKIFQIPYTLRPMSPDGFAGLVSDLSGSYSTKETSVSSPPVSPPRPPSSASPSGPSGAQVPGSPPLKRREVSPVGSSPVSIASPPRGSSMDDLLLDPNPGALELDPRERNFMTQLYELIPTPRAAKRFVNIYRLIRASITSEHELSWFLDGGEFMSVQVLLAMVTGAPAEASEILRKLLALPTQAPWTVKWWDIVDGVVKEGGEDPSWKSFAMRLHALRESREVPETCEGFRKWADDVARYSFYSGRVLLGPQAGSPAPPEPRP
jgi:hypothetical protein